jgi:mannitol-specific phosphotransferase system IIBC component
MANKAQTFLKVFRYGVRFSERWVREIGVQISWTWNTNRTNIGKINAWRIANGYHPAIERLLNGIMIGCSIGLLLPFLILWAGIKSL